MGWVQELAAAAAEPGNAHFSDAPVTGSKNQAAAGELNFLVGGDPATLEQARPALAAMGKNIVSVGPVGSGARLKLINNFVCGVQVAALAEALAMIERTGWTASRRWGPHPRRARQSAAQARCRPDDHGGFHAEFPVAVGKDLGYAIEEGMYQCP